VQVLLQQVFLIPILRVALTNIALHGAVLPDSLM
jgi:hypothetical protein